MIGSASEAEEGVLNFVEVNSCDDEVLVQKDMVGRVLPLAD